MSRGSPCGSPSAIAPVAIRANALGMRVLAADPMVDPAAPGPATLVELDELLAVADVVTLHAPLTEHTRELIGAAQLTQMRPEIVEIV